MIDAFHLCLAVSPVAGYLVLLGAVNLRSRPLAVSGATDTTALGLAASGMIFAGPLPLLVPPTSSTALSMHGHPLLWPMLCTAYGLCFALVLLNIRPRIVVYNVSPPRLRSTLAEVASRLDGGARWAGDCLALPELGVQLHLEYHTAMRNVSLASAGRRQSALGWNRLQKELRRALADMESPRNAWGLVLTCGGTILLAALALHAAQDPLAFLQSARNMFW